MAYSEPKTYVFDMFETLFGHKMGKVVLAEWAPHKVHFKFEFVWLGIEISFLPVNCKEIFFVL